MRLVKAFLFIAIAFGLSVLWSSRDYVIEAYQERPEGEQITLSGVDLAITRSTIGQSPYVVPAAPDSRVEPVPALAFSDVDDEFPEVTMAGGTARLAGVVTGPDGPVADAMVEIQRHTTDGVAVRRLSTGQTGEWRAPNLLGGRYRVRAWVPGILAMGGSEVIYLAEDETHRFEFALWGIDQTPSIELVANEELYLGVPGTVAVSITRPLIDDRGVVVTTPVADAPVTISVAQTASVLSTTEQATGADGVARFVIACSVVTDTGGTNPDPTTGQDPKQNPGEDTGSDAGPVVGTIVVRSGDLVGQFPLPICIRPPAPEPDVESDTTGSDIGSDQNREPSDG